MASLQLAVVAIETPMRSAEGSVLANGASLTRIVNSSRNGDYREAAGELFRGIFKWTANDLRSSRGTETKTSPLASLTLQLGFRPAASGRGMSLPSRSTAVGLGMP